MLQIKTDVEFPCDHVYELSILNLMILYPDLRLQALGFLQESDFHFPENRLFFRTIRAESDARRPVTEETIAARVEEATDEKFRPAIMVEFNQVCYIIPVESHLTDYIERVIDLAQRRHVHALAVKVQAESLERLPDFSSSELIDSAQERLKALRRHTAGPKTEKDIQELFVSFGDEVEAAMEGRVVAQRSVPIGLFSLDSVNRGPFGSELIVIAGRPSSGKTALGLQSALNAANKECPSYIVSLEMDEHQIRERAIANISGLSVNLLREKKLNQGQLNRYSDSLGEFNGKCRVNFKRPMTVGEICDAARRVHEVLGLRLIMVDQLSFIRPNVYNPRRDKREQIAEITRGLKDLALELGIPVMLMVQLNRESEKAGREPMLSDLAESGNIEQDADQVWAIHAPEGIGASERTLIVLKGRNTGAGHRVQLQFLTDIQRIEEGKHESEP